MRTSATGIDIGTYQIKVVVAESLSGATRELPRISGVGLAESRGLRHGYVVNPQEVTKSIMEAVAAAEKASGTRIKRAFISVGGISLSGTTAIGSAMISRADLEITELDIEKAVEASRIELSPSATLNRKIIHTIPLNFKIDGKPVLGRPIGLKGNKL